MICINWFCSDLTCNRISQKAIIKYFFTDWDGRFRAYAIFYFPLQKNGQPLILQCGSFLMCCYISEFQKDHILDCLVQWFSELWFAHFVLDWQKLQRHHFYKVYSHNILQYLLHLLIQENNVFFSPFQVFSAKQFLCCAEHKNLPAQNLLSSNEYLVFGMQIRCF